MTVEIETAIKTRATMITETTETIETGETLKANGEITETDLEAARGAMTINAGTRTMTETESQASIAREDNQSPAAT
jgi:hypothetical protein